MHENIWRCKPYYTIGQQHFSIKKCQTEGLQGRGMETVDSFMFFELSYIPKALNHLADSMTVSASLFVPPLRPKLSYDF